MLQQPRDSGTIIPRSIDDLSRRLESSIQRAEDAAEKVTEFARPTRDLMITYTGLGAVAAWVFSGFYQVLTQYQHADPLPAYHASLHVAPYREEKYRVLHWMGSPWERGETARLADALYIMGVPSLYIVPHEEDPLLQQKIPEGTSLKAPTLLDQVMIAALSSLRLSVEKTRRDDMRVKRLEQELLTPEGVVEGLWSSYGTLLEEVVSWARENGNELDIVHTRIMTPAAIVSARVLDERGIRARLLEASASAFSGKAVLVLYTSTEEDVWREVYFRRMRTGLPAAKGLQLRTDPLSAQVYGVILGLMMGLAGGGE